jgi:hypothetical protein
VIGCAEKCGEAGAGIEAREAQPVDGPIAADERSRLTIADERVVLDPRCHGGLLVTIPCICGRVPSLVSPLKLELIGGTCAGVAQEMLNHEDRTKT